MDFGKALESIKSGKKARRKGWNGKEQYIELATAIHYRTSSELVRVGHDDIGNSCIAFVGTRGIQIGWLASQADMLAEDWEVFE